MVRAGAHVRVPEILWTVTGAPGHDPLMVPTPYHELNALLDEIAASGRTVFDHGLVGVYLQGSFAVGDADLHSDCDFLVVVREPPDPAQERAVRALHDEIPTREGHWTHHLEGSYAVAADLASLDRLGRRWLYVDHGRRDMEWSSHCNTEVARWSLRERGVTVAGPQPSTVVAPVPADVMRARMRADVETLERDIAGWAPAGAAWSHRYLVSNHCRVLYSLVTGEVALQACHPAVGPDAHLDPAWRGPLQQAIDDRTRGFDPDDPPRRGQAEESARFADYARSWARRWRNPSTA